MTDILHASPLKPEQLDKAFALIRLVFQEVSLERWRSHVREIDSQDDASAGWLAVEDDKGYIHGLMTYRVDSDLVCGRILTLRDIILAGVALGRTANCAMDGLSQMAWRNRCDAIHVMLPGYEDDDLDRGLMRMKTCLLQSGFVDRGSHLCRCFSGRCQR